MVEYNNNYNATVYNILCVSGNFYLQDNTLFEKHVATISNTDSSVVRTVFFYLTRKYLTINRM
jgi:hypothetical protein